MARRLHGAQGAFKLLLHLRSGGLTLSARLVRLVLPSTRNDARDALTQAFQLFECSATFKFHVYWSLWTYLLERTGGSVLLVGIGVSARPGGRAARALASGRVLRLARALGVVGRVQPDRQTSAGSVRSNESDDARPYSGRAAQR